MRIFLLFFTVLLVAATLMPQFDRAAAGTFYDVARGGFWLRETAWATAFHEGIQWIARTAAVVYVVMTIANVKWRKPMLFMLVALIIGPGLLTNTVLKDNWGRARPVQVEEFGGTAHYTPALQPTNQCDTNCSFVSGDGALGFYIHTIFYIVPPRWRRRAFVAGFVGGGGIFGTLRIAMGGHWLSDVLWAGLVMLISSAIIHRIFYGKDATRTAWRDVLKT